MDLSDAIRSALNDVLRAQEAADTADPLGQPLTVEKIDIELSGAIVSKPDGTEQFVVLGSDDALESSSGSPWKVAVQLSRPDVARQGHPVAADAPSLQPSVPTDDSAWGVVDSGAAADEPDGSAPSMGPGWGHGGE